MGVSILDELDSGSGLPLDLILPLMVGMILLRVRPREVSFLVIDGVGDALLILRLDLPTHPGTDEGRRLTTRQVRRHPSAVLSEGPGEEVNLPWQISGTRSVSAISMSWGAEQRRNRNSNALLGSINNPLSNQIIMNAERPKFQGTAEISRNFGENGKNITVL
jgi:hypothetical protein